MKKKKLVIITVMLYIVLTIAVIALCWFTESIDWCFSVGAVSPLLNLYVLLGDCGPIAALIALIGLLVFPVVYILLLIIALKKRSLSPLVIVAFADVLFRVFCLIYASIHGGTYYTAAAAYIGIVLNSLFAVLCCWLQKQNNVRGTVLLTIFEG